jgi:hypothetical protein
MDVFPRTWVTTDKSKVLNIWSQNDPMSEVDTEVLGDICEDGHTVSFMLRPLWSQ